MTAARKTTTDALFDGALVVEQPTSGYRFNVDALWLGAFAAGHRRLGHLLDLGAGAGAVTLIAHHFAGVVRATLVEKDPMLARLCSANLARASIDAQVITADVSRARIDGDFDLIVSNPPFFEPNERRAARSDREPGRCGALEPFVRTAALAIASSRVRAAFVYPAGNLVRLLSLCGAHGLTPKRLCFVHSFASEPARIALVEVRRAKAGGLVVEAPLVEWEGRGRPSPELSAVRAGRAIGRK